MKGGEKATAVSAPLHFDFLQIKAFPDYLLKLQQRKTCFSHLLSHTNSTNIAVLELTHIDFTSPH